MGTVTWKALGLVAVAACIAVVASLGLGMVLVGLLAIVATFLVLACMAALFWLVIACLDAWGAVVQRVQRVRYWWKRHHLMPPHVIALRLVLWPFVRVLGLVLCLLIWAGWGSYHAKRIRAEL